MGVSGRSVPLVGHPVYEYPASPVLPHDWCEYCLVAPGGFGWLNSDDFCQSDCACQPKVNHQYKLSSSGVLSLVIYLIFNLLLHVPIGQLVKWRAVEERHQHTKVAGSCP